MLDVLNLFCHGYVATPLIEACRRRGLFEVLDRSTFRGREWLAGELDANAGYFTVALHALESLGWIEKSAGGDGYRLTAGAKSECFDLDLTALYAIEPQRLIQDPAWTAQLVQKLDGILRDGRGADELPVKLMLGAVVLPLVTALQQSPSSLAEVLRHEAIERLFVQQEWLSTDGTLTAAGRHVLQTHVFTISLSYRPMLHAWEDLLFGDHERVYRRNDAGEETHVDRRLNVIASGLQHESYFKDIRQKVVDIFDREPLEAQPLAVVDVGCGDGSLLRQVYQTIREESLRGRHLERFPVRLIGVDYNREALEETVRTLADLSHQTLLGDINRPDELERALAEQCGLTREQRVLHIRSFLDHNIHVDVSQPVHEALRVLAADQPDCYLDEQGRWLDPLQVLSRWQEHLHAWAQCIHDSDLLILEAHALPARQIPAQLASSENFYFDTIHYLSHQYLISAEAFVTLAASAGLFADGSVKRYPKLASFCRISMHHLRRRDYVVRHAAERDLESLDRLERLCWPKGSQIPRRLLRARLERYPQGQFVLERNGEVLAVIYSQRIESLEALDGRDLRNVHELHHPSGSIVQFLALNVDPRVQNLRYGDQLLEFMLQRCSLMTGITGIAGVTVCRNYDAGGPRSFEQYIRLEAGDQDPVLAFHRAHGATIVKALPGYRPRDVANEGYGVLVAYDVHERMTQAEREPAVAAVTATIGREELRQFIRSTAMLLLGANRSAFAFDRPLMEMGLNSADLLALQQQIEQKLNRTLKPGIFFEHGTADKIVAFLTPQLSATARAAPRVREFATTDIAVVGMSCKLPEGIETPDQLWQLLAAEKSVIGPYPRSRGDWPSGSEWAGIDRGGFLHDVDAFDSAFFRISPREARMTDPQQRILLELAWACLEDAAIVPAALKGTQTGVFIGASNCDYGRLLQESGRELEAHYATGTALAALANRLSYFFDLSGPSLLVDTACSSSLVALHTAVRALQSGECSAALVGGINVICHPHLSVAYRKAGMLAPDGRCKPFDAGADGYVRSEGAVMLLLQPLSRAIEERNQIHAVIKGSAVNHGGLATGLTVPNPQKQSELLTAAWKNAGIAPEELSYLEAHGTGTPLGDPIEIQGILTAYADRSGSCAIGSLKGNLGHLEAAAGIAGLLKVILALQRRRIPASANFEQLNPAIRFDGSPLSIAKSQPWDSRPLRLAGVSSFGSGGANAHVVVQEYPPAARVEPNGARVLVPLSARTAEQLRDRARDLLRYLESEETIDLVAVAFTLQVGRQAMENRAGFIAGSVEELAERLRAYVDGQYESPGDPLLASWIQGQEVEWSRLHDGVEPRRISLPTYPFARERHWIEQAAAPRTARLHPLLHARPSVLRSDTADVLAGARAGWQKLLSLPTYPFSKERHWIEVAARSGTLHPLLHRKTSEPGRPGDTTKASAPKLLTLPTYPFARKRHWIDSHAEESPATYLLFEEYWREEPLTAALPAVDGPTIVLTDAELSVGGVRPQPHLTSNEPVSIVYAGAGGRGEAGVHALFEFFKAIRETPLRVARVTLVGQYDPTSVESCWDYAWIGFERSLKLLLPGTQISLLYTRQSTSEQLRDAAHHGGAIWYAGDRRHVLSFRPLASGPATEEVPLRKHGGYLITGGCGALGLTFARHLAQRCQARLLLVGRRPLSDDMRWQLEALQEAGAREVHYQAVDVSDRDALSALAQNLPFELCGVIHAAGVESTKTFYEKSAADVRAVLQPKTAGTLLLDELLGQQPLDFVCYFSSSSAVLGDLGSCDYAIANRFQMAYGHHRRQTARFNGKTIVINWPLWRDGGMGSSLKSSSHQQLETAAGLRIWEDLLRSGAPQALVLVGPPDILNRVYRTGDAPRERILTDLRQLVSKALRIAPDQLEDTTNLADYGFDSLQLANFAKQLTAHFGVEVTPVVFFRAATIQQLADYFGVRRQRLRFPIHADSKAEALPPHSIAIVGMSGRFPGARTVDELWRLLAEGKSAITEIPLARWNWREQSGEIVTNRGGFIDGVDEFDPAFFEISPREAEQMDPGERLLLMEAYRAIEDAGIAPSSLRGSKTGVFAGMEESSYELLTGRPGITTSGNAMISSRLSYFLDLRGPAIATNTACSSGLVALHQAVTSLRQDECDAALVAGVSLTLSPSSYVAMSQAGMLSPDGQCHSFGRTANGIGVGEAVVVLMLKPLAAAVAAGDRVYGVIRASGVNFDGKTNGVTAPSGNMQAELIESVYRRHAIDPADITHVVTHGTGTPLGDPVEIDALNTAFRKLDERPRASRCAITSCKSNVGHTMAASGLVSVVSLLKGMQHHAIPASLHCEEESEYIAWQDSPFYVNKTTKVWTREADKPHLGAVSAFGRSGTNAHVVIEEHRSPAPVPAPAAQVLVPLSARTPEQLQQKARELLEFIRMPDVTLPELAYTLQVGRDAMAKRADFTVTSIDDLADKLDSYLHDGQLSEDGEGGPLDLWREGEKPRRISVPTYPFARERYWIDPPATTRVALPAAIHPLLHASTAKLEQHDLNTAARKQRLLSIPTYPFSRERHWAARPASTVARLHPLLHANPSALPRESDRTRTAARKLLELPAYAFARERHWIDGQPALLHPLLHSNTSDRNGQSYRSTFSGREFFFTDHQVAGRKVLPAVAYLEMARAAVEQALPLELHNTVWAQPLAADGTKEVRITLSANGNGIDYEISSQGAVHCQGRAVSSRDQGAARLDLEQIEERMTRGDLAPDHLYAACAAMGLVYGPAFQSITAVHRGDGELLARLRLPRAVSNQDYVLHPSVMDGALQATVGLIEGEPESTPPRLPFALDSLRIVAPCTPEMVAWVRHAPGSRAADAVVKLDIDLCDPSGNVRVQMHGLSSRTLAGETRPIGSLLATPVWRASVAHASQVEYAQHHLILCELPEAGSDALSLHAGSEATIAQRYSDYALACFERVQAILRGKPQGQVLLQIATPDDQDRAVLAGLSGLLKAAALENPRFRGQVVLVPPHTTSDELTALLLAERRYALDEVVRYNAGARQVLGWQEVPERPSPMAFKDEGVYLIIGGLGGLGMLFAKHIHEHAPHATVVLTGRAEKQPLVNGRFSYRRVDLGDLGQVTELLEAVQQEHGRLDGILHCAGMVADNFILKKTGAEFSEVLAPKVTGTYNLDQASRGVELDFFVLFSSLAGVTGNVGQADYAAANGFLDQFATYRNRLVAGGQRHGRTRSIAWPLWEAGGMQPDLARWELEAQATGLSRMQTATGMRAFHRSLELPDDRTLVVEGDLARIRRILFEGPARPVEPRAAVPAVVSGIDAAKTQEYLRRQLSGLLKLPAHKLDPRAALEEYGIDSVLAIQLTNQLEKTFGSLPKTLFFEYQTIDALAGYFVEQHAARLAEVVESPSLRVVQSTSLRVRVSSTRRLEDSTT